MLRSGRSDPAWGLGFLVRRRSVPSDDAVDAEAADLADREGWAGVRGRAGAAGGSAWRMAWAGRRMRPGLSRNTVMVRSAWWEAASIRRGGPPTVRWRAARFLIPHIAARRHVPRAPRPPFPSSSALYSTTETRLPATSEGGPPMSAHPRTGWTALGPRPGGLYWAVVGQPTRTPPGAASCLIGGPSVAMYRQVARVLYMAAPPLPRAGERAASLDILGASAGACHLTPLPPRDRDRQGCSSRPGARCSVSAHERR